MKLFLVVLFASAASVVLGYSKLYHGYPKPPTVTAGFLKSKRIPPVTRLSKWKSPIVVPKWTNQEENQLVKQIFSVAIPALAACVVEPALTMVDMYFVGTQPNQLMATAGLAGLSVTGAVFNIIAALTYPLCSGTTAVIARTKTADVGKIIENPTFVPVADTNTAGSTYFINTYDLQQETNKQLGTVLLNGLLLSMVIGTAFTVLLQLFSRPIVQTFFALDASVVDVAVRYMQIRGLSLPFTLISYVVIGFCLVVQDMKTPLISILVSSVLNIAGDCLLVGTGGGLAGAAVATSFATTVASLVVAQRLLSKYIPYEKDRSIAYNAAQWWSYIDAGRMKYFFSTSLALLVGMFANTLTYSAGARITSFVQGVKDTGVSVNAVAAAVSALTATASSTATATAGLLSTATVHTAAHQIAMQLWWFMSYFSSPFGLAAEAILPKDLTAGNHKRVDNGITKILQYALTVATVCTLIVAGLLKFRPAMFTSDLAVQGQVQTVLVQVLISHFLICITTIVDGIFIGTNRVSDYIAVSVASTAAAWLYYAFVATKYGLGITGTWNGLLIFCGVRAVFYAAKFLSGSFYRYKKNTP